MFKISSKIALFTTLSLMLVACEQPNPSSTATHEPSSKVEPKVAQPTPQATNQDESRKIADAFQQRKSNIQVRSQGKVIAVLPDDKQGSRHQKFLLRLNNGISVLVAHNIDLAPRIPHIKKGDIVEFYGEYEYTAKGGVIHWTHHDPQKRHIGGWLKHEGQIYQ